jgi:hypothetical protein
MGKVIIATLFCFILQGCKQERITTITTVELLYKIPKKIDEQKYITTIIIPKGEVLKLIDKHYKKDFLVLKVSYKDNVGYIVFDSRKVIIK